ncbi:MAG: hypothetical protein AAGA67_03340 [Cyanobacteria bacterium P01_F01_bin.153]
MFFRVGIVIHTVLWVAAMVPSLGAALMSVMLFDSPGSEKNTVLWVVFWSLATLPVTLIVAVAVSWILWFQRLHGWGFGLSCLPYINAIVFAIALIVLES